MTSHSNVNINMINDFLFYVKFLITPIQNIREIFVWLVYTPFNDTSPIHRIYINSLAPYSLCDWYDLLYNKEEEEDTVYILISVYKIRGRRGRDHMVVGFITTYAISAYHN